MLTFYGTELVFKQPAIPGIPTEEAVLASVDGTATYLGGQAGFALGYKHVFFGFELTCARFWTNAKLQLLDEQRDLALESWIIYPGFALLGEF